MGKEEGVGHHREAAGLTRKRQQLTDDVTEENGGVGRKGGGAEKERTPVGQR